MPISFKRLSSVAALYESGGNATKCFIWFLNIVMLTAWALALGIFSLYYAGADYGIELFNSYFDNYYIITANLIPVYLLIILIYAISNRIWISSLISSILVVIPMLMHYNKLIFRGDPLMATDIALISEAIKAGLKYDFSVDFPLFVFLIASAIFTLFSAVFLRARFKNRSGAVIRVIIILCLLSAIFFCYDGYMSSWLYAQTSNIDIQLPNKKISKWSATDQYVTRGFIYPLIRSAKNFRDPAPESFVDSSAEYDYYSYGSDDIPDEKKVSVIAVMLEAYVDMTEFGFNFDTDPYEFMHELMAESVSGSLVTNIFGGDTVNTELGFITGNSNFYNYRLPTESYARYFARQGYYTEFCHPSYKWFYNRENVYEYLGFDNSWFKENRYFTENEDDIQTDDLFFHDIINLFEASVSQQTPYFNFSVTYQNHGPYPHEVYPGYFEYLKNYGISIAAYNILNNYFDGISSTDRALREFVGYFRQSREPVILVFFGDHKPWLGDSMAVYLELGFNMDTSSEEGFYNYYTTPYVIWANDAAKESLDKSFVGNGGSFSPMFLMQELFDQAGWGGDEFIKASRDLRSYIDVVHTPSGLVRENGELTETPSYEASLALEKFKNLQYYRRRKITPS